MTVENNADEKSTFLEVFQQMKAEIGDDQLSEPALHQMQQKYGIIPPQLTLTEKETIRQEQRRNRMFPEALSA